MEAAEEAEDGRAVGSGVWGRRGQLGGWVGSEAGRNVEQKRLPGVVGSGVEETGQGRGKEAGRGGAATVRPGGEVLFGGGRRDGVRLGDRGWAMKPGGHLMGGLSRGGGCPVERQKSLHRSGNELERNQKHYIQAGRPRVERRTRQRRARHATRLAPPPPAVVHAASIRPSTTDLAAVHDDAPLFA